MSQQAATARRDELLEQVVDHVVEHGLRESSLRQLAAAVGVAHNNLTHHFGSRDALLTEVFGRIQARWQQDVAAAGVEKGWATAMADQVLSAERHSTWVTFFETAAAALRDPNEHADFLQHVSADWVQSVSQQLASPGPDDLVRTARATLAIAAARGLALDLAAGGDRTRVENAIAEALHIFSAWGPTERTR